MLLFSVNYVKYVNGVEIQEAIATNLEAKTYNEVSEWVDARYYGFQNVWEFVNGIDHDEAFTSFYWEDGEIEVYIWPKNDFALKMGAA